MKKILLVEDTAHLAEEVTDILNMEGYEVKNAANGMLALEFLASSEGKPDLIITDLLMPRMDGFEFVRNVRKQVETKMIPVIVLSARATEIDRAQAKEAGADTFIQKPCKAHELITSIKLLIGDNK